MAAIALSKIALVAASSSGWVKSMIGSQRAVAMGAEFACLRFSRRMYSRCTRQWRKPRNLEGDAL
jgi:hypothetical protein